MQFCAIGFLELHLGTQTSGKRKAYKVLGFIDYFTGVFFYKAHTGRFDSASYQAFVEQVMSKTKKHLIV